MEKIAKISKGGGLITILDLSVLVFVRTESSFDDFAIGFFIGAILSQLTIRKITERLAGDFMWICPKCGREFKNTNQEHYCGENPKSIEEYILAQDEEKRSDLQEMQCILKAALPDVQEKISWSMPTYWKKHNICHFAASKKHIGFYPGTDAVKAFEDELTEYSTDKGTIRIPYGKINADLIGRIARWCYETGNHA